jgi:hypothetical protein
MALADRFGPQPFADPQPPRFYHCGICECYHPINWDGDCRDDANRFAPDELDEKYGSEWGEVSMPGSFDEYLDRVAAVLGIYPDEDEREQFEPFFDDDIDPADAIADPSIRLRDYSGRQLAFAL